MQDFERRLRILEDRVNVLRQLIENLENNLLKTNSQIDHKISSIESELSILKKQINELNLKINAILDQLQSFAHKERVEVLERYLDYINPFEFLTKKEAEELLDRLIEEKVKQMLKKLENQTL